MSYPVQDLEEVWQKVIARLKEKGFKKSAKMSQTVQDIFESNPIDGFETVMSAVGDVAAQGFPDDQKAAIKQLVKVLFAVEFLFACAVAEGEK